MNRSEDMPLAMYLLLNHDVSDAVIIATP